MGNYSAVIFGIMVEKAGCWGSTLKGQFIHAGDSQKPLNKKETVRLDPRQSWLRERGAYNYSRQM